MFVIALLVIGEVAHIAMTGTPWLLG